MSTYRQIITLLLLYPEADWNWNSISNRPDIPFWLVLAYPEWNWNWHIIGRRFPSLISQHPELPLIEQQWTDLTDELDPEFISAHPEMKWHFKMMIDPMDIFRYPNIKWNYRNVLEYIADHPEIPWPYDKISSEAYIVHILCYPNFPWVFDIVWPQLRGYDKSSIIRDRPDWPWTEEQRRNSSHEKSPEPPFKYKPNVHSWWYRNGEWSSYKSVTEDFDDWGNLSNQDFSRLDAKNTIVRAWRRSRWWRRVKLLRILGYLEYRGYGCGVPMELWTMVMRYVR